jgi:2-dehydropantoate 2-reductase
MGAGGVGGFYGGRLARGGEDVTFIARGPHLAALQSSGLRIESATVGDFTVPGVQATDDPASVGPVDLIWMTIKAYDLESAARQVQPMVGPETVVIPLLNGVEIAEGIGAVLGAEHMMGGAVAVSASIAEPGLIRHVAMDRLMFGELGGGSSDRAEAIQQVMTGAGIESVLSEHIQKDIWMKFLRLNTYAGIAALTRLPLGPTLEDADVREMALACFNETEAIARAKGVAVDEGFGEVIIADAQGPLAHLKPSMLLDLERGRRMELEVFQGTTVRMGKELGVPTPVNQFIYAALKLHAEGSA